MFFEGNIRVFIGPFCWFTVHISNGLIILAVRCLSVIDEWMRVNAQKPYRHLFVFCKMNCCIKGLIWISKTNGIKTKRGTSAFFALIGGQCLQFTIKWDWDAFISLSLPGSGLLEIWMVVNWENWAGRCNQIAKSWGKFYA